MKCPKCKKPVIKVRKYKDGGRLYIHEQKRVFGGKMLEITESCYVPGETSGGGRKGGGYHENTILLQLLCITRNARIFAPYYHGL